MNRTTRILVLGMIYGALTGQAPVSATDADSAADFCTRLGRAIGLNDTKLSDAPAGWKANALNFGQRFLVGGTATTSVHVEPVEPASVDDYKRLTDMCAAEGKGAVCRLIGPVAFHFGWKGSRTEVPVLPGETAAVRVEGSRTSCQPGGAAKQD